MDPPAFLILVLAFAAVNVHAPFARMLSEPDSYVQTLTVSGGGEATSRWVDQGALLLVGAQSVGGDHRVQAGVVSSYTVR
jgi:hypothetical protein